MQGPLTAADEHLLDTLQRGAFDYFLQQAHPRTGLVADTSRPGSPVSIAVVGFALSAYPVAVERGWIARDDAVRRSLAALRFFAGSDQSGGVASTGCHGFYFHFLDAETGLRAWRSELSSIDTALLIVGMLTSAAYFTAATPAEAELRRLASALYDRVDWHWAQHDGDAVALGWKPECGFLNYGWQGYNEAIVLYALGLGSTTHPLTTASFDAWTVTYQYENLYGIDFLYAGPLFVHQFSHAWIDFRGIRDDFMREKDFDYFENSRRAAQVQRQYAIRNPHGFRRYVQRGPGTDDRPELAGVDPGRQLCECGRVKLDKQERGALPGHPGPVGRRVAPVPNRPRFGKPPSMNGCREVGEVPEVFPSPCSVRRTWSRTPRTISRRSGRRSSRSQARLAEHARSCTAPILRSRSSTANSESERLDRRAPCEAARPFARIVMTRVTGSPTLNGWGVKRPSQRSR